jgi:hypothetical protein
MTGSGHQPPVKRRKILDHAMQVLRETRAKIDPDLLALMKQRISAAGLAEPPAPPKVKAGLQEKDKSVFAEKNVEAMTIKKAVPKASALKGASAYAEVATTKDNISRTSASSGPEMVPVDRQKVATIVLEYMRLREEKKPGH